VCVCQVVFLKKDAEELVILDPDWFGTEVIGRLLCEDAVSELPHDGRLSADDLRAAIPTAPPHDVARLLTTMHLCASLHQEFDTDVVFPCLDRSEAPPSSEVKRPLVNGFQDTSDKVNISILVNPSVV